MVFKDVAPRDDMPSHLMPGSDLGGEGGTHPAFEKSAGQSVEMMGIREPLPQHLHPFLHEEVRPGLGNPNLGLAL